MSQMQDQDKIMGKEKELNEIEISNMPDREFNIMVIKIPNGFEKSGGPQ